MSRDASVSSPAHAGTTLPGRARAARWVPVAAGTALAAAAGWLALAWLGGLTRDPVEVILVALVAFFGYALGTLIPAAAAALLAQAVRRTPLLALGTALGVGALALQVLAA